MPSTPPPVDAAVFSRVARAVVGTPYPWSPGHLVTGPDDAHLVPELLHPAFHGSLDWHSCVHMQWSLLTLLEGYAVGLDERERAAAAALLEERLTPENVAVEAAYLRDRPSFERPYGWAWAVQLAARAEESAVPGARRWAQALEPLTAVLADHVLAWLPRQAYPVRHGKHQNDAFALTLLVDGFDRLGRPEVAQACRARALEWFGADTDAPTAWEPGGTDFLSPALTQAQLVVRLLPEEAARDWLGAFLPGLGEGRHEHLLEVPEVRDGTDGQLVHLAGLALSRAWALRELAPLLSAGAAAYLEQAAQRQQPAVRPLIAEGDFMATHWLVSFALLADSGLRGRP